MKKINLLSFLLIATATSQAIAVGEVGSVAVATPGAVAVAPEAVAVSPSPACPKAFEGWHIGGNIGYNLSSAKIPASDAATNFEITVKRKHVWGVDGGVGVGYTRRLCNWALGIAFDANWSSAKGRFEVLNGIIRCKTTEKNSLDLYARLGYVMREMVMPFVGLGWSNQKWHESASITDFPLNGTFYSNSARRGKRINAFLWKLGVDFLATRCLVVGIEYTGTTGQRFNLRSSDDAFRVGVRPQYNKVALTAKFIF